MIGCRRKLRNTTRVAHCVLNRVIVCEGVGNKVECVACSAKHQGRETTQLRHPARRRPGSAQGPGQGGLGSVRRAPVVSRIHVGTAWVSDSSVDELEEIK